MNFFISSSKAIQTCVGTGLFLGLIFFGASELILRTQIAPQDEFISHTELFKSQRLPNAAFGDSHVARGFVPPEGMINLAYPSEPIPRMAWKVKTYFDDQTPGQVILQADPHMFSPYRLNRSVGGYPAQFENPMKTKSGLLLSIPRYRANLVNYWASFARKGGRLKSEIIFTERGAHLSPGDISKEPARYRQFAALTRAKTHDLGSRKTQKAYREIYADMLTQLEEKGANICMVTFPISPDFRDALKSVDDAERADVFEFFKQEAKRVGAKYINWEGVSNTRSDFRDTDHLNGAAAKRLSPELMTRCFKGSD